MAEKSMNGLTKGTPLEKMTAMLAQCEAKGVMMYYALARLAKEQGLDDAAEKFIEAANQEAEHAGFYAVLSGSERFLGDGPWPSKGRDRRRDQPEETRGKHPGAGAR